MDTTTVEPLVLFSTIGVEKQQNMNILLAIRYLQVLLKGTGERFMPLTTISSTVASGCGELLCHSSFVAMRT